jgi:tetratricopeptide (TPR) repeat protein
MQDKNPLSLPQLVAKALQLHRTVHLTAVQGLYEQAPNVDPRHFDTLHLSGMPAAQLLDYRRADHLLARAIAVRADPIACNYRGKVLKDLGQYDAAVASYDRAIALRPDYAEAHANRGPPC